MRRRSVLSEVLYIVLNVVLAVAVLMIVRTTESPVPALVLVLLSKWRVFAVRPRYWIANIKANLVDFIVSLSAVSFLYVIDGSTVAGLISQIIITALYIGWLVVLKPKSSKKAIALQSGVALTTGVAALSMVTYAAPVSVFVVLVWIVAYFSARHVLVQYEDDHMTFFALVWAFLIAQISWIVYHWLIAYRLPGIDGITIPQVAIIVALLGFVSYKVYVSQKKYEHVRSVDVALPIVFSISVVAVLLIFFNAVGIDTL